MRARLAIATAALLGVALTSLTLAVPDDSSARSRIRVLEQRVIQANLAIQTAGRAEADAASRLAAARARLAQVQPALARRSSAHRAGQAMLANRIRQIYRDGDSDPLLAFILSGGNLAGVAAAQADEERVAQQDAALVRRLKTDRVAMARLVAARTRDRDEAAAAVRDARAHRAQIVTLRDARAADLREGRRSLARAQARAARRPAAATRRAGAPTTAADATAGTPAGGRWPAVPGGPSAAVLARIASCESGGNPRSIGGGGQFRGKYQFMTSTWRAMGGHGDPAAASEAEQDYRAALLFVREGPGQWPVCASFAR
jgi:hypothetical protein